MKYTTILFDFDGTLLESGHCILTAMRSTLAQMGFIEMAERSEEALTPLVGPPLREGFANHLKLPPNRVDEAMDIYRFHAATEKALDQLRPYPGIPELLRKLRANGVKIGMATAKLYSVTIMHLEVSGLGGLMDYVSATKTDHGCDKTKLILEAMEALGADPNRTLMVGDRMYDMEAAVRAGIPGIGVLYGYGSREELETYGATIIVESVEQLSNLLTEQEEP